VSESERIDAFVRDRFAAYETLTSCPPPREVEAWFDDLAGVLFPEHATRAHADAAAFAAFVAELEARLAHLVERCPRGTPDFAQRVATAFFADLGELHAALELDVDAALRGDPAARNRDEVVRTYPGVRAIVAHRVAHALWRRKVPLMARMITEYAHRHTGIDVHPAARIGARFFVDHGTGVVIGATAVVGDDVKLYQGVTLGGLSVRKADADVKRHPTLGDRVVVYAGATVLGGDTEVGHDSVIGGNVWLTRSVPPHTKLTYKASLREEPTPDPDVVEVG
jgi:serine O-acetyltransferase